RLAARMGARLPAGLRRVRREGGPRRVHADRSVCRGGTGGILRGVQRIPLQRSAGTAAVDAEGGGASAEVLWGPVATEPCSVDLGRFPRSAEPADHGSALQAWRELDQEAGAAEFGGAGDFEFAAVAADDVLDDGQADAVAVHALVAAHPALQ